MKTKILKFKPSNPFIDILPKIDVHGYTMDTIFVPVNDFINDNLKLNKKKIVIIHGIGAKILSSEIKRLFAKDKRVSKLYLSPDNLGCTIIELK
jgi:DNA-nicking Smr family endonuclease